MTRNIAVLLSFLACLLISHRLGAQDAPANRVLVIGIDGLRADALRHAATPNLDRLIEDGAYSDTTQILGDRYEDNDTVSGPGWSSFLTGVWADKHGVNDNSFTGRKFDQFPHFFTRVRQQFPAAKLGSFVNWEPIDQYIVSDADLARVFPSHGAEAYAVSDQQIAKEASRFLSEGDPHAVMAYFGAVDETGHAFGFHPTVAPYVKAISQVDAHVGKLLAAIRSRPDAKQERWLVVVSTDHGGRGTNHSQGHDVPEIRSTFLIVSGAGAERGSIDQASYVVDVPVIAMTHLGVNIDPNWKLDGKPVGLTRNAD